MSKAKHFSFFIIAGASAFIVNIVVLYILSQILGLNPYAGQVVGLFSSITTSWWINRRWTFCLTSRATFREFFAYLASMLVSSLVNYGFYVIILQLNDLFLSYPIIALFPATAISMVVSYLGMKFIAFKNKT